MCAKYECIRQHDFTDCAAACIATILKHYGLRPVITKIREITGTEKQGTNAYGVMKAAEMLGFKVKGVKGDKQALFTKLPLPCIAYTIVDGMLLHYVVIHKITTKQLIIADPMKGIMKLKPEEFYGETAGDGKLPAYQWTGVLILICPNLTIQLKDGIWQDI